MDLSDDDSDDSFGDSSDDEEDGFGSLEAGLQHSHSASGHMVRAVKRVCAARTRPS